MVHVEMKIKDDKWVDEFPSCPLRAIDLTSALGVTLINSLKLNLTKYTI